MLVKVFLLRCDRCGRPLGLVWNLDAVFKERVCCFKCEFEEEYDK